jgi:ATP-dependent Clp protease ATP-binding subunit ClpA
MEPIVTILGSVLGALTLSVLYSSWDYLKCSSNECCHRINEHKGKGKPWIDYSLELLQYNLNNEVYGQHLVNDMIPKLIRKHLNDNNPKKALVLSFHGWTGGGKNFVSQIVAKSVFRKYRESHESDFVHHLIATHFHNNHNQNEIKNQIKNIVTNGVKKCERSLFIFDEIDKLSSGVIDVIKPFLDYHSLIDGINYKKAIFIFLRYFSF